MAQYRITYKCGHITNEQLYGPSKDREYRIARAKQQLCPTCYRAAQLTSAKTNADASGLPALEGSEKQINWALTVRAAKLGEIDQMVNDFAALGQRQMADGTIGTEQYSATMTEIKALAGKVRTQSSAAWWIDHRDATARQIVKEAM